MGRLYLYDSSTSSYREVNIERYEHRRSVKSAYAEIEVVISNYLIKTDTYVYEFIEAEQDAKLEIDGVVRFRGKTISNGRINDAEIIRLKILGNGHELQGRRIDISGIAATNVGVVQQALNGTAYDGNLTYPSGATTYSLASYKYKGERGGLFDEMTRLYFWALYFEGNTPYYEPIGYYDSGETIDTSNTKSRIKEWESEKLKSVINKVEVVAVNSSGDDVSKLVDKTGSSSYEERFKRVNAGFVESQAEAEDIANQLIHLSPGGGGRIRTFWYKTPIVNEVITVKDARRGINADFVVLEQINYYPERITELNVGYKGKDAVQLTYERERNLRDERAGLISPSSTDVGQQGTTNVDADNHDHGDGTLAADDHDHGDGTLGTDNHLHGNGSYETSVRTGNTALGQQNDDPIYSTSDDVLFGSVDTTWKNVDSFDFAGGEGYSYLQVIFTIRNKDSAQRIYNLRVETGAGYNYPDDTGILFRLAADGATTISLIVPVQAFHGTGTGLNVELSADASHDIEYQANKWWQPSHQHQIPSLLVSGDSSNTEPGVSGSSGSTSPDVDGNVQDTQPGVSGSTDSKNVDVVTKETKKNRE